MYLRGKRLAVIKP